LTFFQYGFLEQFIQIRHQAFEGFRDGLFQQAKGHSLIGVAFVVWLALLKNLY